MRKVIYCLLLSINTLPVLAHSASPYFSFKDGDGFKRFSVSAGWLHAAPQGSANPITNTTAATNGSYKVGDVQINAVTSSIAQTAEGDAAKKKLMDVVKLGENVGLIKKDGILAGNMSGTVNINSLENWTSPNTGLEADSVDTLGLLFNYYLTDHWSVEVKAGIPPTVDIKGQGQISAPLSGIARPKGELPPGFINNIANGLINKIGDIPLDTQIPITNLAQSNTAATARAWLPAAEIQYQFGRSGVNKFRPYIGAGLIYGYFDKIKLDSGIEADLISAGHRIQNILDNKAGAALEGKTSSADPRVKVEASDSYAPIVTLGATYDFNENWYAVGSVSYAKMNTDIKITVADNLSGKNLINSSTKLDIDPIITYMGIGYRF